MGLERWQMEIRREFLRMAKLVMVRSTCCESYKECGTRCSVCPNRPENQEAVRAQRQILDSGAPSFARPGSSRRFVSCFRQTEESVPGMLVAIETI